VPRWQRAAAGRDIAVTAASGDAAPGACRRVVAGGALVAIAGVVTRLLVVIAIMVAAAPAAAQPRDTPPALVLSGRIAGGMDAGTGSGQVRPSAAGFAGLELLARVGAHSAIGVTVDRVHRELPDGAGPELAAGLVMRWTGRRGLWGGAGAGVRRIELAPSDPLLGAVVATGPDLRMELGGRLAGSASAGVGVFFTWSFGCYARASYRDPGAWVAQRDRPPPPTNVRCIDSMFSSYLFGVRGTLGR